MIILLDAEKVSDESPTSILDKNSHKTRIGKDPPQPNKAHLRRTTANIILLSERLSPKIRGKVSVQHCTGGSNLWIRQKK